MFPERFTGRWTATSRILIAVLGCRWLFSRAPACCRDTTARRRWHMHIVSYVVCVSSSWWRCRFPGGTSDSEQTQLPAGSWPASRVSHSPLLHQLFLRHRKWHGQLGWTMWLLLVSSTTSSLFCTWTKRTSKRNNSSFNDTADSGLNGECCPQQRAVRDPAVQDKCAHKNARHET